MAEEPTQLILSDEALSLFFLQGGFGCAKPIDLRPLLALECDHGQAVRTAAERWNVPPGDVVR